MQSDDDLLMRKRQVDVFLCACGCRDVLSLVIKLVVAVLSARDQLRYGPVLETKIHTINVC